MGNPYGTDKGFATRFHTGPTWANHIGHRWKPYGPILDFDQVFHIQPASVEYISDLILHIFVLLSIKQLLQSCRRCLMCRNTQTKYPITAHTAICGSLLEIFSSF